MRIVQQPITLTVTNNDLKHSETNKRHGELLRPTIRCLLVGPSNCGKTNTMISLIEHSNGLRFENVYVYSKSLFQPKYQYLENLLKPIKDMNYFAFNDLESNIPPPSKAKSNSIFIFDDVACDKQNLMREYFSMGRHKNIDCFYLCQTYSRIPKQLIGDNANLLILFKQDNLNLRHIYEDFKEICSLCWKNCYDFLVIDLERDNNAGRYRKGFDSLIQPHM
jgi:GTPase SAR1 family protein